MAVSTATHEQGSLDHATGPEPILAVDPGTSQTYAALVVGGQWRLLSQPGSGARAWPPVAAQTAAAVLAPLRAEARRRHGAPVERLAIAVPPDSPDGPAARTLLAAAHAVGAVDVELVPDHVAAVLDPASGPDHADGVLVLVCDLGARWSAGLVRVAGEHTTALAGQSSPAGLELDASLRWLVRSCRDLVAGGGEVAGVVLTGGWAQHRGVVEQLRQALALPDRVAPDPELAVLRGLVRWAAAAGQRRVPAEAPRWRVRPLSWRVPGGDGRLMRWLVSPGSPYPAGAVLAQIRSRTDRVFDVVAPTDGVLLAQSVATGGRTGPTLVTPVAPPADAAAYDPPPHRHRWTATGGWLLTARLLVEWDRAGAYVQSRNLGDGSVSGVFQPDHGSAAPERAGVFVDPAGRFCLLTWDLPGEFSVWDIATASLRTRFQGPPGADQVFVDEPRWRLAAEAPDSVSVGRYRRTAVTFWDLAAGRRIDKAVDDDWRRHHPGYAQRSAADRFTADTASPDGRLRAVAADGTVTLRETATERVVFRAPSQPWLRTAFSADGRFLLASWEADQGSTVDVWTL